MRLFTLREIADEIALVERRPDREAIYEQVKGAANIRRKLLNASDATGFKGAALYPAHEFALARLVMAGVNVGLAGRDIAQLAKVVRAQIDTIISTLHAGEPWLLCLCHTRALTNEERKALWGDAFGDDVGQCYVTVARRAANGTVDPCVEGADVADCLEPISEESPSLADGRRFEAVSYINISALLRPYLPVWEA